MVDAPCGTWRSPIAASDVARGGVRFGSTFVSGDGGVWWSESRPTEGGRTVIVCRGSDGRVRDVLPQGWNVRTRVHEYGGGAWLPLESGALVFANWEDQRLYLLEPKTQGGPEAMDPRPLTSEPDSPQADRYADLVVSFDGNEVICVRERSVSSGIEVERDIVAVALDGSFRVRSLLKDGHFLSNPRPSPDGRHLAWLTWDHPRMPWDGTELRVAEVSPSLDLGSPRTLVGGMEESVFQPEWADAQSLYAVSDRTGWWNLYEVQLSGELRALCTRDEEFGHPQWVFGMSRYGVLGDGRLAVTHGRGTWSLSVLDPVTGDLTGVEPAERSGDPSSPDGRAATSGVTYFEPAVSVRASLVAAVGGGPDTPLSVLVFDVDSGRSETLRSSIEVVPAAGYLPPVRQATFEGPAGREVHAFVYEPANADFEVPEEEHPPCVAFVHGGPTAQVTPVLDMQASYFTSRGVQVVAVDYGGSTGYGREYRNRLRGLWGIVDVEDVVAVVEGLCAQGGADATRLLIRGGSAGGWTVLCALTQTHTFAAGASYYGVVDLIGMAEDTHDFESRYIDALVGPLPEAHELYLERSPLSHVDELERPILLLQGAEDKIVPPSQAEVFRDAMLRKGISHAYLLFDGEQHGFRRAETIEAALEAELSFYGQVLGFEPVDVPLLSLTPPAD